MLAPLRNLCYLCAPNPQLTRFAYIPMPNESPRQREMTRRSLKKPDQYMVIMHNDDFTTMDFVVKVLKTVFRKSEADAETLMMTVHKSGSAIVGIYTYDIALSKVNIATAMARQEGFPFKMTIEPDNTLPF